MDFYSNMKSILFAEKEKVGLVGVNLYLIRRDGSIVYTDGDSKDTQTVGALISGAWQATMEILKKKESAGFRFSFGSSSSGIYVLSLVLGGEVMYLASMFENEMNPGRFKVKMRKMRDGLDEKLDGLSPSNASKDDFLFEDLSDDEVNSLFSFGD